MEQMLWDAACSIRGEKDAAKFKDYLLPLLFLKRLSDVFDDEIERLAEEYGDRATALEIAESDHHLLRFYLPPEARWAVINGRQAHDWPGGRQGAEVLSPRDVGEHLTRAVRAVVRQKSFALGRYRPGRLRGRAQRRSATSIRQNSPPSSRPFLIRITGLVLPTCNPDFLGRAYAIPAAQVRGRLRPERGGNFFTPTEVGFLMAYLMRPKPGENCHDYACGSAGAARQTATCRPANWIPPVAYRSNSVVRNCKPKATPSLT